MAKKGPKYSGVVTLGATYVSPDGVECVPVAFSLSGIRVEYRSANGEYAFTRIVSRAVFAAYVKRID